MPRPVLLASVLVVACSAQSDEPARPTTTIAVNTTDPAALVAARDWDGDWRAARATSPTTFEVDVSGPHVVAVVCQHLEGITMAQVAQTLTNATTIDLPCGYPYPPVHEISFLMVQPGFVTLERSLNLSSTGDWDVWLSAPTGVHDVVALGSDHVAVRSVAIDRDVVLPMMDLAAEGFPLVASPVTATNATASERLSAQLRVRTRPTDLPAQHTKSLAALAVAPPEAQLRQTVAVIATDGVRLRQLRRPFQLGDDAAFVLPDAIGPLAWDFDDRAVTVEWATLPEHQWLTVEAHSATGMPFSSYTLEVSAGFMADTGITRATIETDIPGFKDEWILDGTRSHLRQLSTTRSRESGAELSTYSETTP